MLCEHVYKTVGADTCPHCGKDTHEIDWSTELEARRTHREKHGILYNTPNTWWSI
jgi:hypothetical protein